MNTYNTTVRHIDNKAVPVSISDAIYTTSIVLLPSNLCLMVEEGINASEQTFIRAALLTGGVVTVGAAN